MNKTRKNRIIGLLVIIAVGLLLSTLGVLYPTKQSREGELMIEACEDISSYETFNAEEDIHKLIFIIRTHMHAPEHRSGDVGRGVIDKLLELENEVVFHNVDMRYYKTSFAGILNELTMIEMQDAIYYTENGYVEKAKASISNVKHYLHDALFFMEGDTFRKEFELLHEVNGLKTNAETQELKRCVELLNKIKVDVPV